MSRIIVKNLPKGITAKKLENLFSTKGFITDLQLKYNKAGIFRQFAFIGYKTEEEAAEAKQYFHNTFVNTSKIQVEICKNLGDPDKPKTWKKKGSTEKIELKDEKIEVKKSSKKKISDEIPEELKDDPQFKEFLGVNKDRKSKPVWAEDIVDLNNSDLEDLDSSEDESIENTVADEDTSDVITKTSKKDEQIEISEKNAENTEDQQNKTSPVKQVKSYNDVFTVKIRNLPYQCKKNQVKKFFQSLKITSLRLPPRNKGFAYVSFKTEKDLKQALNKHRGFLDGHRVDVVKYVKKVDTCSDSKSVQNKDNELNEELLAETGRIYVRNLCYSVTEEEIEKLFGKFGTLAEVHLPIDYLSKKAQGYAFVSYVFAEHAVKAFAELDGTIFQGRVLHLIPAKAKKEYKIDENETNFKKKKASKLKEQSGSSHNWNILFLGMNAVADVVAEKYNIEKSKLLSGDSKSSVAVRMALAETEMVTKTRKFLIENGVQLDAFSQPAAERSKTVIVAKHLPANTTSKELNELFSKHGTISRILLPPSGLIALIEYENPTEAKMAFKKLAYSRFHCLPLYLEWAPMDGIKEAPVAESKEEEAKEGEDSQKENLTEENKSASKEDNAPSTGTTVFVKNLNFSTTQENFAKHFKHCGPIHQATISIKRDPKKGKFLSMGFGFVQFKKRESAVFAIQNLQRSLLDGHSLELKFANREIAPSTTFKRKKQEVKKQTSSKILVRNVPFNATEKEVTDLFKEFGILENVRLPKKIGAPGEHRGFAFVQYQNVEDAERAFESLCHSTHLFNRRLILEWANTAPDDVQELRKKTASNYSGDKPRKKLLKSKLKEDVAIAATRHGTNEGDEE